MNAEEIQSFSQTIAFHPIAAIGGLSILIAIARKKDLDYKEIKKPLKEESKLLLDKSLLEKMKS